MTDETKSEKFRRLAERRTSNVLKALEVLSNLSNKSQYEWSDTEIDQIADSIKTKLTDMKSSFVTRGFKITKDKGFEFTENE